MPIEKKVVITRFQPFTASYEFVDASSSTNSLSNFSDTTTHQLASGYYCVGIMKENFHGSSSWLILKAFYNGTGNDLPLTFHGNHYYKSRPKYNDVTVTGAWGLILTASSKLVRLCAPWSAMNNNIGEISVLVNPDEMSFDGITF